MILVRVLVGVNNINNIQINIINQSINQSKHISVAPYVASESEAHDDGH